MTRWHQAVETEAPLHAFERRMTAHIYIFGVMIVVVSALMMWKHG